MINKSFLVKKLFFLFKKKMAAKFLNTYVSGALLHQLSDWSVGQSKDYVVMM